MTPTFQIVRYKGSFFFRDRPVLDQTELAALEGGWLRCFGIKDTQLTVHLALEAGDRNQTAATEVFALLSREALEGSVIASINDVPVEYYSVRPWAVS